MTSSMSSCKYIFASSISWRRIKELNSSGLNVLLPNVYCLAVPMSRLNAATLSWGWVIRRSFANRPTKISSSFTLTTLGVIYSPNAFGINSALLFRQTQANELVVPKSIPIIAI